MNVYLVTSGSFEEYSIDAVFSDRAKADAYVNGSPNFNIEEWELDEKCGRFMRKGYCCSIDFDGGELTEYEVEKESAAIEKTSDGYSAEVFYSVVSFVSASHARSICVAKRRAWMRKNGKSERQHPHTPKP